MGLLLSLLQTVQEIGRGAQRTWMEQVSGNVDSLTSTGTAAFAFNSAPVVVGTAAFVTAVSKTINTKGSAVVIMAAVSGISDTNSNDITVTTRIDGGGLQPAGMMSLNQFQYGNVAVFNVKNLTPGSHTFDVRVIGGAPGSTLTINVGQAMITLLDMNSN